jgi:hypothetical protein
MKFWDPAYALTLSIFLLPSEPMYLLQFSQPVFLLQEALLDCTVPGTLSPIAILGNYQHALSI